MILYNSLTRNKAKKGSFPLLIIIPVRSRREVTVNSPVFSSNDLSSQPKRPVLCSHTQLAS